MNFAPLPCPTSQRDGTCAKPELPVSGHAESASSQHEARRLKLAQAQHQRKEQNLQFRQLTLSLECLETAPNPKPFCLRTVETNQTCVRDLSG